MSISPIVGPMHSCHSLSISSYQNSFFREMLVQSIADLEITTSELSMELEDFEGDDGGMMSFLIVVFFHVT